MLSKCFSRFDAIVQGTDDPLIEALKRAKEKRERDAPPDIKTKDLVEFSDLSFHPEKNLIAVGNVSGKNHFSHKEKKNIPESLKKN